MEAPRWFYVALAACFVVVTLAVVYALVMRPTMMRPAIWATTDNPAVRLNTRTGEICARDKCFSGPQPTAHSATASPVAAEIPRRAQPQHAPSPQQSQGITLKDLQEMYAAFLHDKFFSDGRGGSRTTAANSAPKP